MLEYARNNNYSKLYITGDMNINLLNDTDIDSTSLLNLMSSYFVFPIITKVTRPDSCTLLDHVWTNDVKNVIQSYILLSDVTDHYPCISYFRKKRSVPRIREDKIISKRIFNEACQVQFLNQIKDIDWSQVMSENDVNIAYNNFYNMFFNVFQGCFPVKHLGNG